MIIDNMLIGLGRFSNRKTKTKGKDYDHYFFYVPVEVARDKRFPFKDDDRVIIKIDEENKRVIIEEEK